jgi:hypothetical protein
VTGSDNQTEYLQLFGDRVRCGTLVALRVGPSNELPNLVLRLFKMIIVQKSVKLKGA